MTDPKGDRSRAPHEQSDPDLYLHVVERREDGIVVRGAKAHQTGALNSHEIIVMPTISMGPEDKDYAVSFAVPMDSEGIFMIIGRQSCDTRKRENSELDVGNSEFGGVEALTVFDNVFVPNERIFLNGCLLYTSFRRGPRWRGALCGCARHRHSLLPDGYFRHAPPRIQTEVHRIFGEPEEISFFC